MTDDNAPLPPVLPGMHDTSIPPPPSPKKKRKGAWSPERKAVAKAKRLAASQVEAPASFTEALAPMIVAIKPDVDKMLRAKARELVLREKQDELEARRYEELLDEERALLEPQEEKVRFRLATPSENVMVDQGVKVLRIPTVNIVDPLGVQVGVRVNSRLFVTNRPHPYEEKRSLFAMIAHSCFCAMRVEAAVGNPNRDFNVVHRVDARAPGAPAMSVNTIGSVLRV